MMTDIKSFSIPSLLNERSILTVLFFLLNLEHRKLIFVGEDNFRNVCFKCSDHSSNSDFFSFGNSFCTFAFRPQNHDNREKHLFALKSFKDTNFATVTTFVNASTIIRLTDCYFFFIRRFSQYYV